MRHPWLYLLLVSLLGVAAMMSRLPVLVLILQAGSAWVLLALDLRAGAIGSAALHMLGWAVVTSVLTIAFTVYFPAQAAAGIFHGVAYREEMFRFIRAGVGAEGDPRLFIPEHCLHYGLTLALSFLTAGLAGLALGAILLNYMNFYVGELIRAAVHPALAAAFGWPVWSMLRVTGFVLGAVAVAHLMVARVLRRSPWQGAKMRKMLLWSVGLFLADMLVKGFLAPHWRKILLHALGP